MNFVGEIEPFFQGTRSLGEVHLDRLRAIDCRLACFESGPDKPGNIDAVAQSIADGRQFADDIFDLDGLLGKQGA